MKKLITFILVLSAFFTINAQSKAEIRFIKGDINEKINTVKESSQAEQSELAQKAVDFVLENMSLIKDDRDLGALAVAGILSYPVNEYVANSENVIHKFSSLFYGFSDNTVRTSVLSKINLFYKEQKSQAAIDFINNYLKEAEKDKKVPDELDKKVIMTLGSIGNTQSFIILYNCYLNQNWAETCAQITKDAIVNLASESSTEINSFISTADNYQLQLIYTLFVENSKTSKELMAQIAENILTKSMILVRESSRITEEAAQLQFECVKVLSENNWTRIAPLMLTYFDYAKQEYAAAFITQEQFIQVISFVEKLASKNSAKYFIAYLENLNRETEKNNFPADAVVSAVIKALGALGDKSAFDSLLYTTYLPYNEEIIAQARSALSSLKW